MNANQTKMFNSVAEAVNLPLSAESITVTQTPTFLKEELATADYATGIVSAFGAALAEIAELRGLEKQSIEVDRRQAVIGLNDGYYHYLNGTVILGGEIEVPVNSFQKSKDGKWMCFNGAYPHLRDGILNYFDATNSLDSIASGAAQKNLAEIETYFEENGYCMAPLMTKEEWLAHPQGVAMSKHPVIYSEQRSTADAKPLPKATHRPLEGLKVIDVTHVVAGPWATRQLAEYGADVISVRNPVFPFLYPVIFEESYGKKQIQLSLKEEAHLAKFKELLKDADALVWGYGPGSLERLGLTQQELEKLNPNLVVTQVSCYGPTGPWKNRKGWEQLAQTCTGMVDIASKGRNQYHLVGALPLDYGTGILAATAVVAGLIHRHTTGGIRYYEAMLARSAMELLSLDYEPEEAMPVAMDDMHALLVDQQSAFGATFTRIKPYVTLSPNPGYCSTGPAILGAHDPVTTTWEDNVGDGTITHKPSEIVKRGLWGFFAGFGHEDIMLREED